jgi:CRP-like cAMP-binding protein
MWSDRTVASPRWRTIRRRDRRLLERGLERAPLAQGVVCFEPGDPIDRIYFPASGMISLLVVTGCGATVEATTIGREGAARSTGSAAIRCR